jgi:cold shock CspA family protein
MINGHIILYHDMRRYGFIQGEDNRRYFFHKNSIKSNNFEIEVGLYVIFTPGVSPKGYKALDITIREVDPADMRYQVPDKFIRTQASNIKGWKIINALNKVVTVKSKNLQEARQMLEELAISFHANAVINETYKKTSDTDDGRYYYSVHNLSGMPVQVARLNHKGDFNLADFVDMAPHYEAWEKAQAEKEWLEREKRAQKMFKIVIFFGAIVASPIIFMLLSFIYELIN